MSEVHVTLPDTDSVGVIIMGSSSDWPIMQHAFGVLQRFGIAAEAREVAAHRMPIDMVAYASNASSLGLRAIMAGAAVAAPLLGRVASLTVVLCVEYAWAIHTYAA